MNRSARTLLPVAVLLLVVGSVAVVARDDLDDEVVAPTASTVPAVKGPVTTAPPPTTAAVTTSAPLVEPAPVEPVPVADTHPIVVPIGVVSTPSGILAPVLSAQGNGTYEVQTPCDARAVVPGTLLAGVDVVLDPGHGGSEPGAVGPNGLAERDLNLAVAQRLAHVLRADGLSVVLTRDLDVRLTLAHRANIAVGLRPRAFLSIHHNAASDGPSAIPGTEVYFQVADPESRRLAGLVVEEVRAALAPFGVAWESDDENGGRARIRSDGTDFYGILRRSGGVPSVLSEAGYLSNPAEAGLFATAEGQQAEAEGLARALGRFLAGDVPGDGSYSPAPPSTGASGGPGGGPTGCVDPELG